MRAMAMEALKAVYRYARIPLDRFRPSEEPLRVLFVRRAPKEVLQQYFPGERVRSRDGGPPRWEFYMKWAPWLLADSRSRVYHADSPLPRFVKAFCARFRIPTVDLTQTRPDIPTSFLMVLPSGGRASADAERSIPSWFQSRPTLHTKMALASGKPVFLYVPWIAEHGDALMSRIEDPAYEILPFDIMKDVDNNENRRNILRFARSHPDLYRQMVVRRLVPIRSAIAGVIVTFDWAPVMRIIVSVCQELGIPTILIPHESVFVDRSKYYWDPSSHASIPLSDVILGWGRLQKDIFVERGYPAERFQIVGAPKFDTYHNYEPMLTRAQFATLFGLNPEKKIILFASQPLDSQLDTTRARESQRAAIADLLRYCETNNAQLIVRLPPSKDDILGLVLRNAILQSAYAAFDDATCYLVAPEEALFHCDIVTSVNSTMLFEGLLLGRCALSLKYVEFAQFWDRAGIPVVRSLEEAAPVLDRMLAGRWERDEDGMQWAADMFGIGAFDGQAAPRIRSFLSDMVSGTVAPSAASTPMQKLASGQMLDVAAVDSNDELLGTAHYFLPKLLNIRALKSSLGKSLMEMASVEAFFQVGLKGRDAKEQQRTARLLGKPVVILEEGFIRSLSTGVASEPALSVIIDDTTAHYDATRQSGLERVLEHGRVLNNIERRRALAAIRKIVEARISRYNHAPDVPLQVGRPGRAKLLVIDQRYGNESVEFGLADERTFDRMVKDALAGYPEHDIIVSGYVDPSGRGKRGYFEKSLPQVPARDRDRVFFIQEESNPYALIDLAEIVFVVSSLTGFEALMAGRQVHCYGAPFYAGWGLTVDHCATGRRSRKRAIEDVFHFAYIEASRYVNPQTHERIEVEELIDFVSRKKAELVPAGRSPSVRLPQHQSLAALSAMPDVTAPA